MRQYEQTATTTTTARQSRPAAGLSREDLRRVRALLLRATEHDPGGPLRSGLKRGMLTTDPDEQRELEALARGLWSGHIPSSAAAGARLAQLARTGKIGATAMMAGLSDEVAVRTLAAAMVDESTPRLRRLAAVRSSLVAWQSARDQEAARPIPLMAALRRLTRDEDDQLRFMGAFVLAMMGRREVRPLLERGLSKLQSAPLLSYCVLGLREIGNDDSLRALRRVVPRCSGSLAQTAHEAIQTIEMRLRPPVSSRRPAFVMPNPDIHERETVRMDRAELARRLFPQRAPVIRQ